MLSQLTPLAIGYLTDHVLAARSATFQSVLPILLVILLVNVVNEVIKVIRRLIVEDAATQAEKNARQRAALSLLMAPLSYFRGHMTGNIHGRLNRSLEGTVKLIKLLFMDFAPAVSTGVAAIVTIFLAAALPGGLPGDPGHSRGHLHRLSADQHPEGHPGGTDGHQGRDGRHHGGIAGRH